MSLFDIVIPLGPNEYSRFPIQLKNVLSSIIGFRNVYIVCSNTCADMVNKLLENIGKKNIFVIDESIFPFSISDLLAIYPKQNRVGWYFQQLLKLYAGSVIPDILQDYLVIDADVFFMRPINTCSTDGQVIFDVGSEFHPPYFKHMLRLHPCFKRMSTRNIKVIDSGKPSFTMFNNRNTINEFVSGINHHMMFRKQWLDELFLMVEASCKEPSTPFWKIFMQCVDEHLNHAPEIIESGASEYELYFHFLLQFHPNEIILRKLNWKNVGRNTNVENLQDIQVQTNLDFISVCHWMN